MQPPSFDVLMLLVGLNPLPVAISAVTLAHEQTRILLCHTKHPAVRKYAENLKKFLTAKLGRNRQTPNIALMELPSSVDVEAIRKVIQEKSVEEATQNVHRLGFDFTVGKSTMSVHTAMALDDLLRNDTSVQLTLCYLDAETQSLLFFGRNEKGELQNQGNTYLGLQSADLKEETQRRLRFTVTQIIERLHGWKIARSHETLPFKPMREKPLLPKTAKTLMQFIGENPNFSARLKAWIRGRMEERNEPRIPKVLSPLFIPLTEEWEKIFRHLEQIFNQIKKIPSDETLGEVVERRLSSVLPQTTAYIQHEIRCKESDEIVHLFAAWIRGIYAREEPQLMFPPGLEFLAKTLEEDGASTSILHLDQILQERAKTPGENAFTYFSGLWLEDAVHAHMNELRLNGANVFHETKGNVHVLLLDEQGDALRRADGEPIGMQLDVLGAIRYELVVASCTLAEERSEQKDRLYAVVHQSDRLGGARAGALFVAPLSDNEKRLLLAEIEGSIQSFERVGIFGLKEFSDFSSALIAWLRRIGLIPQGSARSASFSSASP